MTDGSRRKMKTWAEQGNTSQPSAASSKFGSDTEHCNFSWNVRQQINSSLKHDMHGYSCSTPTANISMQMSDKQAELSEMYRQKWDVRDTIIFKGKQRGYEYECSQQCRLFLLVNVGYSEGNAFGNSNLWQMEHSGLCSTNSTSRGELYIMG